MNGYIGIDCTGLDLIKGSTPQTISGIYSKVKDAMDTGKAIYAYNCNWSGAYVTPIEVFAIDFTTQIIVTSSTLQIIITPADVVTINNMVE